MNKTLLPLAIPLIAGDNAAAGCGSSSDQSAQARDVKDLEKALASATTAATADRRAASSTPALGPVPSRSSTRRPD